MSVVLGKNVVFSILSDGAYKPIACTRNVKLTTESEIAGKSTLGSGTWQENKGISNAWRISADGIISLDTNINLFALRTFQFQLTPVKINFESDDDNGQTILYSGSMLIQSVDESGNYNDVSLYSMQGVGTGRLSMLYSNDLTGDIFYGLQSNSDDPTDFSLFIVANADDDIEIPYGDEEGFFWMAHTVLSAQKTNWIDENDLNNGGIIGQETDLFQVRQMTILGNLFTLYITKYATRFGGINQIVKYYIQNNTCDPPTDFAIVSVTNNNPTDTGSFGELQPVTLTFSFVNTSPFKAFSAALSDSINADVTITKDWADGYSDNACGTLAIAHAFFDNGSAFVIPTGSTSYTKEAESTTGTWNTAIRYKIFNVIVNGTAVNNGDYLQIGSYIVKMVIPICN